jgi:hypothetical protein
MATRAAASMTHESGFHMKLRNYYTHPHERANQEERQDATDLEECVLFLRLELVGTEDAKTTGSLFVRKTFFRAVKKFKHVLNHDGLQVDFFLIIEVLSLEFDLYEEPRLILYT